MADNTTLNAGTGGDVIGSDDIAGVKYQRVKLIHGADGVNAGDVASGNPLPVTLGLTDSQLRASAVPVSGAFFQATQPVSIASMPTTPVSGPLTDTQLRASSVPVLPKGETVSAWPRYDGVVDTAPQSLSIDNYGALVTRGAVLTDEGTFRVNFANTSLAVSIGTVTISGSIVTGTGFNSVDINLNDYFKLDSDADTAWAQIDSVDSDTQITLTSAYVGGTSGAASRSLLIPTTANGATVAVASGQCTLASGTTSGARAVVARQLDYAPLVWRSRLSISQRIVNQSIRFGLVRFGTPTLWFARFRVEGTTATTLICESGRNPSTAPSAAETESTTVTLPNGLTTASLVEYRVEMLTESVRFYIGNVLVAEHSRSIPGPHDVLGSGVLIENTGTAASNTDVVIDYITGKNHNKLEVGVMSDVERIVAASAPVVSFAFTQPGVIAINTTLLTIDCSQHRSLSIQCTAMGTTGVVTPQWSNDGATWLAGVIMTPAGASAGTFNAAGLWTTNVYARFFRLQLTTATTAGTTTLAVAAMQQAIGQPPAQPVNGTVTANIGTGSVAAGTNAIGDVGVQVRTNATGAASTHHIVSAATTNVAQIKATAGRVVGWCLSNTTASWRYVKLHNVASATAGAAVQQTIGIPPNDKAVCSMPPGIAFTTAISRSIVTGSADADATAVGVGDVVGDIFFA